MSKSANLLVELYAIKLTEISDTLVPNPSQKDIDKARLKAINDFALQIHDEAVNSTVIACHKQNFTKPIYKD